MSATESDDIACGLHNGGIKTNVSQWVIVAVVSQVYYIYRIQYIVNACDGDESAPQIFVPAILPCGSRGEYIHTPWKSASSTRLSVRRQSRILSTHKCRVTKARATFLIRSLLMLPNLMVMLYTFIYIYIVECIDADAETSVSESGRRQVRTILFEDERVCLAYSHCIQSARAFIRPAGG